MCSDTNFDLQNPFSYKYTNNNTNRQTSNYRYKNHGQSPPFDKNRRMHHTSSIREANNGYTRHSFYEEKYEPEYPTDRDYGVAQNLGSFRGPYPGIASQEPSLASRNLGGDLTPSDKFIDPSFDSRNLGLDQTLSETFIDPTSSQTFDKKSTGICEAQTFESALLPTISTTKNPESVLPFGSLDSLRSAQPPSSASLEGLCKADPRTSASLAGSINNYLSDKRQFQKQYFRNGQNFKHNNGNPSSVGFNSQKTSVFSRGGSLDKRRNNYQPYRQRTYNNNRTDYQQTKPLHYGNNQNQYFFTRHKSPRFSDNTIDNVSQTKNPYLRQDVYEYLIGLCGLCPFL